MGLREKIERLLAPENFPVKEEPTHDSWGMPLPKRPVPEVVPTTGEQNEQNTAQRIVEGWRDFREQAIGETAVCGITGGLVIAESTRRPEVAE